MDVSAVPKRCAKTGDGAVSQWRETRGRVGIWAQNRWEWVMVQYATAAIGAIMVNINPAYRQHELNYVLQQAGITTIIASEQTATANCSRMIQRAQRELEQLQRIVTMKSRTCDEVFDVAADVD